MTDNLILYELQNMHEALTKTKEEHTLNLRMIRSTEKFNFSEPILNTTKLGLIRLSVYNTVFNVNRSNNQFLYASTVIDSEATFMENRTLILVLIPTPILSIVLTLHQFLIIIIKESHYYIQLLHQEHMS